MPFDRRKCRIRTSLTFYEQSDKSRQEILCFYSASSLKQQSGGRHVIPLLHINMIRNQPVFTLISQYCALSGKSAHFIVFSSNPRPTTLEANTLSQYMYTIYAVHNKKTINRQFITRRATHAQRSLKFIV